MEEITRLCHLGYAIIYLQGFIHPNWFFGISYINKNGLS